MVCASSQRGKGQESAGGPEESKRKTFPIIRAEDFLPFCLFMVGFIRQEETMMSAKTRHQRKLYEEVSLNESFNRSILLIV